MAQIERTTMHQNTNALTGTAASKNRVVGQKAPPKAAPRPRRFQEDHQLQIFPARAAEAFLSILIVFLHVGPSAEAAMRGLPKQCRTGHAAIVSHPKNHCIQVL